MSTKVSRATIGRIPLYLQYLKKADPTLENISATALAKALDLGEVQVRKDLAAVSGAGRPKTGYQIRELIASLDAFICADRRGTVVIVGAGKLGRALLDYGGFAEYGSEIIAAFDIATFRSRATTACRSIRWTVWRASAGSIPPRSGSSPSRRIRHRAYATDCLAAVCGRSGALLRAS